MRRLVMTAVLLLIKTLVNAEEVPLELMPVGDWRSTQTMFIDYSEPATLDMDSDQHRFTLRSTDNGRRVQIGSWIASVMFLDSSSGDQGLQPEHRQVAPAGQVRPPLFADDAMTLDEETVLTILQEGLIPLAAARHYIGHAVSIGRLEINDSGHGYLGLMVPSEQRFQRVKLVLDNGKVRIAKYLTTNISGRVSYYKADPLVDVHLGGISPDTVSTAMLRFSTAEYEKLQDLKVSITSELDHPDRPASQKRLEYTRVVNNKNIQAESSYSWSVPQPQQALKKVKSLQDLLDSGEMFIKGPAKGVARNLHVDLNNQPESAQFELIGAATVWETQSGDLRQVKPHRYQWKVIPEDAIREDVDLNQRTLNFIPSAKPYETILISCITEADSPRIDDQIIAEDNEVVRLRWDRQESSQIPYLKTFKVGVAAWQSNQNLRKIGVFFWEDGTITFPKRGTRSFPWVSQTVMATWPLLDKDSTTAVPIDLGRTIYGQVVAGVGSGKLHIPMDVQGTVTLSTKYQIYADATAQLLPKVLVEKLND